MQSDLVVLGAGPAGIATAIAARLQGLQVTVLDHRKPPIDKPCGEGLLPEAVAGLRRLGIGIDASVAFPFVGIRFSDRESSVNGRIASGEAYGMRRTMLHQLLVERATELRVHFLWGARVSELYSDRLRASGEAISFRWLVGADGQNSSVRRWAGLNPRRRFRSRFGFRRHYAVVPWSDYVEVHGGDSCQLFVTPTGAEEVCVALLSSDPQMRIERALAQFPEVARRLRKARAITQEAGAISVLGRARAVARGNVALVGDASGAVDGIAGKGLSLAFQQALALGEVLAREDLTSYHAAHRRITSPDVRMTRLLLLLLDSSAWLRRKVMRLFANNPGLFAKLIAIHTRGAEARELEMREVAGLGWRIWWA
jgi:menaquinone-9 beta-reductase